MENIEIITIEVLASNELSVTPIVNWNDFSQFIYRAATGVAWSDKNQCFMSPIPKERSLFDWYGNIVTSVISEMGVKLIITPETKWLNVPQKLQEEIENYDSTKNT